MWCFILFALYYYVFLTTYIHSQASHMMRCDTTTPISFAWDISHRVELLYIASFQLHAVPESSQATGWRGEGKQKQQQQMELYGLCGDITPSLWISWKLQYVQHVQHYIKCIFDDEVEYPFTASHCSPHIKLLHLFNFFVCVNLYY